MLHFVISSYDTGLPVPKPRTTIPRIITYQRKRANRRILNEEEFIAMLKEFGELQVGSKGLQFLNSLTALHLEHTHSQTG